MINVSNTFKEKLKGGQKVWEEVEITFPDGTVKTLQSEIMNGNNTFSDCAESNSFPIGTTICKSITLELDNTSDQWKNHNFYQAKVHAYLKMQLSDESSESIIEAVDKGIYTITTPEQYGEIISFTALDDMYKTNVTYATKLELPQTAISLLRDACDTLEIPLGVSSMEYGNVIVSEIPENVTFRQVIGWIAMLDTANARIDTKGYLQFIKWDFKSIENGTAETADLKDYFDSPTLSSDDIAITGIKIKNGDNSEQYGNSGYILELENNLIGESDLATVAVIIGDSIIGTKFRNLQGDMAFNPLIEFGDIAYTYDRNMNKYLTPLTDVSTSLNGKTTVKTQADDPIRGQSQFQSEGTKAIIEAKRLVRQERTAREKALEVFSEMIDSATGVYTTVETQEDGSQIFFLHDKPTLAESKAVWKMTSEAWGVSTDGGTTWNGGMTVDGDTVVRILNATGINADWINTGAITIKDSQGNVIFQADMDTKRVTMSGESVQIGKSSLNEKMASLENDVALSRNMTMTLTNDFQTITANADGSIPPGTFPDVSTQAIVMYGSQDITKECSFTITKSDAVSGNWDEATATYTVTGITEDSAWVDIKATYLSTLSVTKRFGISKIKAESGRTYFIEASCNVLKRSADNTMSPNFIEFKAYYRDGTSTTRTAYNGRFVIEETKDGNTWTTLYTSSADENTVKHYLYSVPVDGSSQAISDGTSMIGIPRDVTNIRCRLYAAGGTTTLMDMESIAVVVDVDALTHEEIFDLLTNKGMIKGIYKEGDQIYISFTYAKGGTLVLGGVGNGNGKLIILDASGNQVGYIDNTGVNFEKGTFTGILSATSGDIGGWIIDKANGTLKSANGKIVLNSKDDRITINGIPIRAYGNGVIIDGGLTIRTGSDDFSDGTDSFQLYNISTLTSGNYLRLYNNGVFQSSSSSKRYKEIGQDISEKDIDPWYNIQPVWAKYKDGYLMKNDSRNGIEFPMFVAEDVEEYFPLAVDHLEDGKAENWNERIMIPAMFAMIKYQKQKIDILENEITEIKKLLEEKKE